MKMMQCGHAANATMDGVPVCAICLIAGVPNSATMIAEEPDLTGRRATCLYREGQNGQGHDPQGVASSTDLAFFEHRPHEPTDHYYCGCWGWD